MATELTIKEWVELTGQDYFDPIDISTIISGSIKRGDKIQFWAFKISDLEMEKSHVNWMDLVIARQSTRLRDEIAKWSNA